MTPKKFKNKYRTESSRLKNWDYSSDGFYFITIVTKQRECFWGEIISAKMILNDLGDIVQHFWDEIPSHFSFIKLDEMIVMPNHIHGILLIDKKNYDSMIETPKLGVSTIKQWKPGTIGVVINPFKRICTINSRRINPEFGWQPRFHDHIIRNKNELNRIRKYIKDNPQMWERDRNNLMG